MSVQEEKIINGIVDESEKTVVSCPTPTAGCCFNQVKEDKFDECQLVEVLPVESEITCKGRLLKVNLKLKNVCPNKDIVVGVLLYEGGKLKQFRVKQVIRTTCGCGDLEAGEFCFVLKEGNLCAQRAYTVKIIANYLLDDCF